MLIPVFTEADTRTDRDLSIGQHLLGKFKRAHRLISLRNRGPHKHRGLRQRHLPIQLIEPLDQDIAPLAIRITYLLTHSCGPSKAKIAATWIGVKVP